MGNFKRSSEEREWGAFRTTNKAVQDCGEIVVMPRNLDAMSEGNLALGQKMAPAAVAVAASAASADR